MAEYLLTRAGTVNPDKIDTELRAANAAVTGTGTQPGFVKAITNADLAQNQIDALQAVVTNHDPALTSGQQTDTDLMNAGITARDARDYIRRALYNGTALPTVYTTMKQFIDSNPKLLQEFTRDITFHNAIFGWTVSAGSNAGAQQTQYVFIARQTLALL